MAAGLSNVYNILIYCDIALTGFETLSGLFACISQSNKVLETLLGFFFDRTLERLNLFQNYYIKSCILYLVFAKPNNPYNGINFNLADGNSLLI